MLQEKQRKTLFSFVTSLQKLLAECVDDDYLENLSKELNKSIALMERDFPIAIQVQLVYPK